MLVSEKIHWVSPNSLRFTCHASRVGFVVLELVSLRTEKVAVRYSYYRDARVCVCVLGGGGCICLMRHLAPIHTNIHRQTSEHVHRQTHTTAHAEMIACTHTHIRSEAHGPSPSGYSCSTIETLHSNLWTKPAGACLCPANVELALNVTDCRALNRIRTLISRCFVLSWDLGLSTLYWSTSAFWHPYRQLLIYFSPASSDGCNYEHY